MTEKRIKSTPGGAGPTSCARPSNDAYRSSKFWDNLAAEKKRKEKEATKSKS